MARRGGQGFAPRAGSAPGLESLADAATFRLSEAEAAAAASDYQSQFGPWTSQVKTLLAFTLLHSGFTHLSTLVAEQQRVGSAIRCTRRRTRSSGGLWRSTGPAGRPYRPSLAAKATRRSAQNLLSLPSCLHMSGRSFVLHADKSAVPRSVPGVGNC